MFIKPQPVNLCSFHLLPPTLCIVSFYTANLLLCVPLGFSILKVMVLWICLAHVNVISCTHSNFCPMFSWFQKFRPQNLSQSHSVYDPASL